MQWSTASVTASRPFVRKCRSFPSVRALLPSLHQQLRDLRPQLHRQQSGVLHLDVRPRTPLCDPSHRNQSHSSRRLVKSCTAAIPKPFRSNIVPSLFMASGIPFSFPSRFNPSIHLHGVYGLHFHEERAGKGRWFCRCRALCVPLCECFSGEFLPTEGDFFDSLLSVCRCVCLPAWRNRWVDSVMEWGGIEKGRGR